MLLERVRMTGTTKKVNCMKKREEWVDYVKIFACILVVTGHFFMSMTESRTLEDTALQEWFIKTIYYFHVPLFFACSGYLYQKNVITTFFAWKRNVFGKFITLGVPYFVFSFATWLLKNIFSGSVNSQNNGLLITLFLKPSSPYWYLYTLFFIFLVTPPFAGRKSAITGLVLSIALKYFRASNLCTTDMYAITQTFENLVWFVLGMCLCVFRIPETCKNRSWKKVGILCSVLFLFMSCLDFSNYFHMVSIVLSMGMLGCTSVFLITLQINPEGKMGCIVNLLSQYTMPIYLMHTIFAAGVRAVLLKLGVTTPEIHIVLGLGASFAGPIIAAELMKKLKLDILYQPGKYIKINK